MTLEEVHRLANRLEFRARQIAPVRQVVEDTLAIAGEDVELSGVAGACLAAAIELECRSAALVVLLRQRRDEASARVMERFQAAEGPGSEA